MLMENKVQAKLTDSPVSASSRRTDWPVSASSTVTWEEGDLIMPSIDIMLASSAVQHQVDQRVQQLQHLGEVKYKSQKGWGAWKP